MTLSNIKKQVFHFHHQGNREYQEDAWYISEDQKLFIICDGVGGANNGSLASEKICSYIADQYKKLISLDSQTIENLIQNASQSLKALAQKEVNLNNMATTIALLYLKENTAIIAHVGDSRIYHYNPSNHKLSCTKDHSLVQELFDLGVIKTQEEMSQHPMKNRITRAISSNSRNEERNENAHIDKIQNISDDSVFLICSDGVNESVNDNDIFNLLQTRNLEHGFDLLKENCIQNSKDNNTCIIVKV
jgi:protein phosphatase